VSKDGQLEWWDDDDDDEEPGLPDPIPGFDGRTYSERFDYERLGKQAKAVFVLMRDGRWRTLRELSAATGYPEASVSARLRDFRKPKFGGHEVDDRRRHDPARGVWEYRLTVAGGNA